VGREFIPFTIGNRFRISPEGTFSTNDDRIDITMAPGAFGSGEHETTISCLETLESLPSLKVKRVLDLGSGTGILAIAALKLGAESALCVDIDPAAVKTCHYNGKLNQVDSHIEHLCGTLDDVTEENFDLILANIYGDILLSIATPLTQKAAIGAPILLSGMLYEYNFDIRQRYLKLGCKLIQNHMLDEFSTTLLQKTSKPI
jgi:ribosomal protein L11 methyltransferase